MPILAHLLHFRSNKDVTSTNRTSRGHGDFVEKIWRFANQVRYGAG
jgi:hypothetical protein